MATPANKWPSVDKYSVKPNYVWRFSSWCNSPRKRCFDLTVATAVLVSALPLFPVVALLIKLTSKGPIFFIHDRVGRFGRYFRMIKFRTMEKANGPCNTVLTRVDDSRITTLGRYLRRWKIDELPQLINVIRGEMSLIGPRPHIARLLGQLPACHPFLSLRPGVTGLATMLFRHEERILPQLSGQELEDFYINNVLSEKIQLELQYARQASVWTDLLIIMRTLRQMVAHNPSSAPIVTSRTIVPNTQTDRQLNIGKYQDRSRRVVLTGSLCICFLATLTLSQSRWLKTGALPTIEDRVNARHANEISERLYRFLRSLLVTRTVTSKKTSSTSTAIPTAAAQHNSNVLVWADISSGSYYCPHSDMYGSIEPGKYITEEKARIEHLKPAHDKPCEQSSLGTTRSGLQK